MRTIYKVIPSESGKVIVQSNDGKLYSLESENGGFWWEELPPLPQDNMGVDFSVPNKDVTPPRVTLDDEWPGIFVNGNKL